MERLPAVDLAAQDPERPSAVEWGKTLLLQARLRHSRTFDGGGFAEATHVR